MAPIPIEFKRSKVGWSLFGILDYVEWYISPSPYSNCEDVGYKWAYWISLF